MSNLVYLGIGIFGYHVVFGLPPFSTALVACLVWLPMVAVTVHELGHVLGAIAMRGDVYKVHLGMGPTVAEFGVGTTQVSLGIVPIAGIVWALPPDREDLRRRFVVDVLSGPLAGSTFCALVFLVSSLLSLDSLRFVAVLCMIMDLCSLQSGVGGGGFGFEAMPRDGEQIRRILRESPAELQERRAVTLAFKAEDLVERGDLATAEETVERGVSRYPDSTSVAWAEFILRRRQEDAETIGPAIEHVLACVNRTDVDAATRADYLNDLAYSLLSNPTYDPVRALGLVEEALDVDPSSLASRDTWAWALIESGEVERGLEVNRRILTETLTDRHRAQALSIRALALERLGDRNNAIEHLKAAAKLDESCWMIQLAEHEITMADYRFRAGPDDRPPNADELRAGLPEGSGTTDGRRIPWVSWLVIDDGDPYLALEEESDESGDAEVSEARHSPPLRATTGTLRTFWFTRESAVAAHRAPVNGIVEIDDWGQVKADILDVEPGVVRPGMRVELRTRVTGTDEDGTEWIGFGFVPVDDPPGAAGREERHSQALTDEMSATPMLPPRTEDGESQAVSPELEQIGELVDRGEYVEATSVIEAELSRDPDNAMLLGYRWWCLLESGDVSEVAQATEELVERARTPDLPDLDRAWLLWLLAQRMLSDFRVRDPVCARVLAEEALQLAPMAFDAITMRAWSLIETGDVDQGLAETQRVLDHGPPAEERVLALGVRAIGLEWIGSRDDAIEALTRARRIERNPWFVAYVAGLIATFDCRWPQPPRGALVVDLSEAADGPVRRPVHSCLVLGADEPHLEIYEVGDSGRVVLGRPTHDELEAIGIGDVEGVTFVRRPLARTGTVESFVRHTFDDDRAPVTQGLVRIHGHEQSHGLRIKANLLEATYDEALIGQEVILATYLVSVDDDGTQVVGFGFRPSEHSENGDGVVDGAEPSDIADEPDA